MKTISLVALVLLSLLLTSCSHKKTKKALTQDELRNKVVALVDVNGAKEAKLQTEVAIVNEIISKGRFQIVDRATVQSALVEHPTEADWQALGRQVHADLLLKIDILEFKVDSRQGYDGVEEEDSLLSSEHRESRSTKWKHLYKVKAQQGFVKVRARFFDVKDATFVVDRESEAERTYNSREGELPRNMKILEDLTQHAVATLFDHL